MQSMLHTQESAFGCMRNLTTWRLRCPMTVLASLGRVRPPETGLQGMADRLAAVGAVLTIRSEKELDATRYGTRPHQPRRD